MTIAKRISALFAVLTVLFFSAALSAAGDLRITARSAILMDMTTDRILFAHNADAAIQPASITKVLSLYVADEAIREGEVHPRDPVKISRKAGRTGGSKMFLQAGSELPLEELLKGMAVVSANDASVAVAEYIGGNIEKFVERMNRKARELGMYNSFFRNPNGLPAKGQVTTARDILILARDYLLQFPGIPEHPLPAVLHLPGDHPAQPQHPPEPLPQRGRSENRLGPQGGIPHRRHGQTRGHPSDRGRHGGEEPEDPVARGGATPR